MTPRSAARLPRLRQLLRLPFTLLTIHRIIRSDGSLAAADEHLWAFRGFHLETWDPHYRSRSWNRVRLADIGPGDVAGLPVRELAFMMHVAMEIEDPIVEYSHQNGEGFRLLLPTLARFMGRSDAEAAYAAAHGLPWCESPWCAEERRHGNTFAKVIERLTAAAPPRDNPNQPRAMTADEDEALDHLVTRQAAEWSSSSTYVVMAAHATGGLRTMMRNLACDEIKHLCILSAADRYLLGPRPWRRFGMLLKIGVDNFLGQKRRRSGGQQMGANLISAIEVVVAHMLMEWRLRAWLATVPLRTLVTVFETTSTLPEIQAEPRPAEAQAHLDTLLRLGRQRRDDLARWKAPARTEALAQRAIEDGRADEIARVVASEGTNCPVVLRRAVHDRLRDHQIRNNRHVLTRD